MKMSREFDLLWKFIFEVKKLNYVPIPGQPGFEEFKKEYDEWLMSESGKFSECYLPE